MIVPREYLALFICFVGLVLTLISAIKIAYEQAKPRPNIRRLKLYAGLAVLGVVLAIVGGVLFSLFI